MAVYFKDKPANKYVWNDHTKLLVIPDYLKEKPPKRSMLGISLECSKDWPLITAPILRWCLDKGTEDNSATGTLDDKILDNSARKTTYRAPLTSLWIDAKQPQNRKITCKIKNVDEGESKLLPLHENENIHNSVVINEEVEVTEKKYKAHLKIRVRPSDLDKAGGELSCNGVKMMLTEASIVDSFVKEFEIYMDISP